jgi:xylose dehydrogenase (NAD/NADP)
MRFGVLSTANIGRAVVIPAIREAGHEVTAIASRDVSRARSVADAFDIDRAYGDYGDLLADDSIDAVYNPLPNTLHAEWTKRAADHGLDVLCEKPLATDAATAREMVSYCEDADVTLMEAYMWRYHPRTERAATLAQGFGDIRRFEAAFHFPTSDPENIRLDPDLGGGALLDLGCYAMNAARLFLGEPDSVFARSWDAFDSGVDTTLTAELIYGSGATAQIACSFETDWVQRYRLDASDGWLEVEDAFNPQHDPVSLSYGTGERTVSEEWSGVNQYAREIEAFVEAVSTGEPPRTGGQEPVRNMELIDAIYESAASGDPVEL